MKDDSEHRSEDRPSSDAPDGTQDRDGSERSSNQSQMLFDESPGRFLASRGEGKFEGASGMLFEQAMAQTRMAICLTDPNQHDNPIVFANRAFRELTGYDEDEILGRNCRFLQGRRTDREQVQAMRRAIESEEVTIVELLNYRKDGSAFWNALHLGPIYNDAGDLIYFFGSQWDVTDVKSARAGEQHARVLARELSHRMKNMFAVISGIVTVSGRMHKIEGEAAEINSRHRHGRLGHHRRRPEGAAGMARKRRSQDRRSDDRAGSRYGDHGPHRAFGSRENRSGVEPGRSRGGCRGNDIGCLSCLTQSRYCWWMMSL